MAGSVVLNSMDTWGDMMKILNNIYQYFCRHKFYICSEVTHPHSKVKINSLGYNNLYAYEFTKKCSKCGKEKKGLYI